MAQNVTISVCKVCKTTLHKCCELAVRHSGEKTVQCDQCSKVFSSQRNLKSHYIIHTGERSFRCIQCNSAYYSAGILKKHIQTHTKEREFQCDHCGKRFPTRGSLSRHQQIHTGEKPFRCDQCFKTFLHAGDLKRHNYVHTGEKPYKCDICEKSFLTKYHLNRHMSRHTGEKPFTCHLCARGFFSRFDLSRHAKAHTNERSFTCPKCHKDFTRGSSLNRHMKSHTDKSETSSQEDGRIPHHLKCSVLLQRVAVTPGQTKELSEVSQLVMENQSNQVMEENNCHAMTSSVIVLPSKEATCKNETVGRTETYIVDVVTGEPIAITKSCKSMEVFRSGCQMCGFHNNNCTLHCKEPQLRARLCVNLEVNPTEGLLRRVLRQCGNRGLCSLELNETTLLKSLNWRFSKGMVHTSVGSMSISIKPSLFFSLYGSRYENWSQSDLLPYRSKSGSTKNINLVPALSQRGYASDIISQSISGGDEQVLEGIDAEVQSHKSSASQEHLECAMVHIMELEVENSRSSGILQRILTESDALKSKVTELSRDLERIRLDQQTISSLMKQSEQGQLKMLASHSEKVLKLEDRVNGLEVQGRELAIIQDRLVQQERRVQTIGGGGGEQECGGGAESSAMLPVGVWEQFANHDRTIDVHLAELSLRLQCMEMANYDGVLIWKICEYRRRRREATTGSTLSLDSQPFYTSRYGYKMCARVYLNGEGAGKGSHISFFFVVMQGDYDDILRWPFQQKVTLMLLDQRTGRRHVSDTFQAYPLSSSFTKPTSPMNVAIGSPLFVAHSVLEGDKTYMKNDTLFFKVVVDTSEKKK